MQYSMVICHLDMNPAGRETAPQAKLSMLNELSQKHQHLPYVKNKITHPEMVEKLKNIRILVGQTVLELLIKSIFCIFQSVTQFLKLLDS